MASNKPVIATNVGSIPKVVMNNDTGLLVSPGDVENLAKAMLFMIKNEDTAKAYGRNGFKRVQNYFLSEHMCRRYISIYRKLLSKAWKN
jgi:glycosyltransferase involved in cell wall biosynthesis